MASSNFPNELICPIGQAPMTFPITVPCCGQAFDQVNLAQWFEHNQVCPLCNSDLSTFDPLTAPKNVNLASMIETFNTSQDSTPYVPSVNTWTAECAQVFDVNGNPLSVSELIINLINSNFVTQPSLFIALVDKSGSMGGTGWTQVQAALTHIVGVTQSNPLIKTIIINYDSMASILNLIGSVTEIRGRIAALRAGGGTNFRSAFEKVREVLERHTYSESTVQTGDSIYSVSNVVVAFLTDGQDGGNKTTLVSDFRDMLETCWLDTNGDIAPISVHAIGFGTGCDKDLLESMRVAGSIEGTFRYADPSDDADSLCQKFTSIFDIAAKSSSVPITVQIPSLGINLNIRFPVNANKKGIYQQWLDVPADNVDTITITSTLDEGIDIPVSTIVPKRPLLDKWIGNMIDQLAAEILDLSRVPEHDNVFNLHCGLIEQRVDAMKMSTTQIELIDRLNFLSEQVAALQAGSGGNMGRLADMRFSSQFAVVKKKSKATNVPIMAGRTVVLPTELKAIEGIIERPIKYSRNNEGKSRNTLQEAIMSNMWSTISNEATLLLDESTINDITFTDIHGNNALHLAAYCGQDQTVQAIMNKYPDVDINLYNDKNESALTLAIKKRGFHRTIGVLLGAGATIPANRLEPLEKFAADRGLVITAALVRSAGSGSLDLTKVETTMTPEYIKFLYDQAMVDNIQINTDSYLTAALANRMSGMVSDLLSNHGANPTITQLLNYCIPPKPDDPETSEYIELATFILSKTPELINATNDDIETPLFKAAEKGSLPHVQFFITHGATIDVPNILGNTPLWVACAKRYPCIIEELLGQGADPNHTNIKGNPPLYTPCKMGPKKIVETMLAYGAQADINENSDTLLLISCRNGQPDILELLLNYVDSEFIDYKPPFDGFNCMMASVEGDRPECVRILHDYGISLNQRTDSDNTIIADATPAHLAAYYNKVNAMKMLITLGANINAIDQNGHTPLHIAVIQGNVDIIRLLRDSHADITIQDSCGNTPAAYCRNRTNIRKVLINPALDSLMSLARGSFTKDEEVRSCVLLMSHTGVIGCLTSAEAVNIVGHDGSTPLMHAIQHGQYEVARTLIYLNADPEITNQFGLNCYFWSEMSRNPRIKKLFKDPTPSITAEQVARVRRAEKECRGLLFLGSKPDQVEFLDSSGIDYRMEYCINTVCAPMPESNGKGTLVSYINKPELANSNLLWNSKIHVINMLASSVMNEMLIQDLMAMCLYTNNSALIELLATPEFSNYSTYLNDALRKCVPYEGDVFIGSTNVVRRLFTIGTELTFGAHVSGSSMWRVATEHLEDFTTKKKLGTVIIIKSRSGRFVGNYSQFSYDSEVIFEPNTKFVVTNWYHGNELALGQENIRGHTYQIKETEIPQFIDCQKSLIIELCEV